MAKQTLTGVRCFLDGYDVSGDMNAVAFQYGAELVDVTTIGALSRARASGLKTLSASLAGYWEAGTDQIDATLYDRIGAVDTLLTMCPEGSTAGGRAFFAKVASGEYAPGGAIGDALAFTVAAEGATDLRRGVLLAHATSTGTTNGSAVQAGAATATQTVAAALHVTAASGTSPSLVVTIQSDDNSGFSSPTGRFTFTSRSAIGAELLATISGPITDTYWRAVATISGTGPSFTYAVALSIQ